MVGAGRPPHRLGEPALLAEPVVAAAQEVADRVVGEERTVDARATVASSATALAPFSQNSNREVVGGSGQAQPGQSKPSGWLSCSSVRAPRRRPTCRPMWRSDQTTPGSPAA